MRPQCAPSDGLLGGALNMLSPLEAGAGERGAGGAMAVEAGAAGRVVSGKLVPDIAVGPDDEAGGAG